MTAAGQLRDSLPHLPESIYHNRQCYGKGTYIRYGLTHLHTSYPEKVR